MEEHPQTATWRAWMRGKLEPESQRIVVRHFLTCPPCRRVVAVLAERVLHPAGADAYDIPLRRAGLKAAKADREFGAARLQAGRELAGCPFAPATPRLTWARAEAFLLEARGFRRTDAELAKLVASMAEALARKLYPADFPPGALAQLQADCGVEVANALRIAGDLAEAEKAFGRAALAVAELADDLIDADRGSLRGEDFASFLIASRRYEEAAGLLEDLAEAYFGRNERHAAGRVLIRRGLVDIYRHEPHGASHFLSRGFSLLDHAKEPALALAAIHNLIGTCSDLGSPEGAAQLLKRAQPLYESLGGPLDLLKAQWLAGKIAAKRRSWFPAEAIFGKLRAAYRERDLPFHEALVTLDLAVVWLAQGRHSEIFAAVEQMLGTFRALHIAPEALAALSLLHEAAAGQAATLALIEEAAGRLEPIAGRKR